MLAQFELEPWHFYTGGVVGLAYGLVRCYILVINNRREAQRELAKDEREAQESKEHTEFFRRIAVSSEETADNFTALNERLSSENLRNICKCKEKI